MTPAEEFLAEHISEHPSKFNQWCLCIGDSSIVTGALIAALGAGHRRAGVNLLLVGLGITVTGHIAERNVGRAFRDSVRHPVWTVRGDLVIIRGLFRQTR